MGEGKVGGWEGGRGLEDTRRRWRGRLVRRWCGGGGGGGVTNRAVSSQSRRTQMSKP